MIEFSEFLRRQCTPELLDRVTKKYGITVEEYKIKITNEMIAGHTKAIKIMEGTDSDGFALQQLRDELSSTEKYAREMD